MEEGLRARDEAAARALSAPRPAQNLGRKEGALAQAEADILSRA